MIQHPTTMNQRTRKTAPKLYGNKEVSWVAGTLKKEARRYDMRNKHVCTFRDSLLLLPNSLNKLGESFCPELGRKGDLDHSQMNERNILEKKEEVRTYMKQDIYLLGGIMIKAQELFWDKYKIDIVTKMTISSLALTIFRSTYYDPKTMPIHVLDKNQDTFVRSGYYGGHCDVYIPKLPKWMKLWHYDVNSLYPYIMKFFVMPIGLPKWISDFKGQSIGDICKDNCGF
jgi:hypothetical protein